ncbi:MAG: hypothetical protein CVV58_04205 [Tenericutes bacterium HGW-Tenericutes-3]|nr:MAG: hypothetical protein CVV58_04205 [Tenericutes bacterium HGW-Tenericutes-3]
MGNSTIITVFLVKAMGVQIPFPPPEIWHTNHSNLMRGVIFFMRLTLNQKMKMCEELRFDTIVSSLFYAK